MIAGGFNYNLFLQSIFSFFRLYLFVNFTENTLLILEYHFTVFSKKPMHSFPKTCWRLNSRISSDITQIQDTFNINHSRIFYNHLIIGGVLLLANESIN
jgi:hypothetical protein